MLSVLLAEKEHEQLMEISALCGMKKSEFVRALIQGAYVSYEVNKQLEAGITDISVEIGGYGFQVDYEAIKGIFGGIADTIGDIEKHVTIKHPNGGILKHRRYKKNELKKTA